MNYASSVHRCGLCCALPFGRSALLLLAFACSLGCSSPPATPEDGATEGELAAGEDNPEAGFLLKGLRVRVYNGSDLHYSMKAKRAVIHPSGERANLNSVSVEILTTGTVTTTLSGDSGVLFLKEDQKRDIAPKDFALSGNINFLNEFADIVVPSITYRSGGETPFFISGGESCKMTFPTPTSSLQIQARQFRTDLKLDSDLTTFTFFGPGEISSTILEPSPTNPEKIKQEVQ